MYLLIDGSEVTQEQIKLAFESGNAVLVHGRADGKTTTGLKLDGEHFDTRGECYSAWEETWTREPKTIQDCYRAAFMQK